MADEEQLPNSGVKRKICEDDGSITYFEARMVSTRRSAGFQWFGWENGHYLCLLCRTVFKGDKIEPCRLETHANCQKHQRHTKTMSIAESFKLQERTQYFHEDVALLVMSNDIPFSRFESVYPAEFTAAMVARKEPQLLRESTYRKNYAWPGYVRWKKLLVANLLHGVHFSLIVDESSKNNRKVMNTIAMTATTTLLIDTKVFDCEDSVTAEVVKQHVIEVMNENELLPHHLVGVTRDNAAYMVKAVKLLQEESDYKHILSVPCLSHGLNLVAKALIDPFLSVTDVLFGALKKLYSKPTARRGRAATKLPGIVNAVQVSDTRWGGWLDSISFVFQNVTKIQVRM
tara:strand:+ start:243 stop:1274 length:1032 start_codon:yes stop_codon:yes gene_type:complete